MLTFLDDILTEKEVSDLEEILDFSLSTKIDLEKIQENIATANYYQSKLTKIILKLRLNYTDFEIAYDQWYSQTFHDVIDDYNGREEFLKTPKDFEREIKGRPEYKKHRTLIDKVKMTITSLEMKEKELTSFDWKVKSIVDIHKIQHGIKY
jgi:hypothetical protein